MPNIDNELLPPEPKVPWGLVLILVIGAFMSVLDTSIVNVALPRMMAVFGASSNDIEWIITGYMLASGVIIPMSGYLCDRFGHRRMYVIALVIFTLGSAFCGLAWSTSTIISARIVQALGGGLLVPISMSMLYIIVPKEKSGTALGVWGIAAVMGPAIGPTLGGYLIDAFSWPWIFMVNIPIGVLAVILSLFFLPETPLQKDLKPDILGTIFIGVSAFAILLGLSQGQEKGWSSQYIVTIFALGIFTLVLFVLWELSASEPLINMEIFKNPIMPVSLMLVALTTFLLYSVVYLVPIYAQNLMGYSPTKTGILLLPMALVTGIFMLISGKISDKYGALGVGLLGLIVISIFTYVLRDLSLVTDYGQLQILLALRAIGIGLAMMPLANAGMAVVPTHLVGSGSSAGNLVRQVSGSIGVAFTTYFVSARQSYHLTVLNDQISYSSATAPAIIGQLKAYLGMNGIPGDAAHSASLYVIGNLSLRQAYMNGIDDLFVVLALAALVGIPLVFMLSKRRVDAQKRKLGIDDLPPSQGSASLGH
ncbi:MAG: DHA2 family efflux MFS transporter permease subunit [Chitinophagales bacterium]